MKFHTVCKGTNNNLKKLAGNEKNRNFYAIFALESKKLFS